MPALARSLSVDTAPSYTVATTASNIVRLRPRLLSLPREADGVPSLTDLSVQIAHLEQQAKHSNEDRSEIKRRLDLMLEILNKVAGVADQVAQLRVTMHERNNELQRSFGRFEERTKSVEDRMMLVETTIITIENDIKKLSVSEVVAITRREVNYWWIGGVGAALIAVSSFFTGVVGPWIAALFTKHGP